MLIESSRPTVLVSSGQAPARAPLAPPAGCSSSSPGVSASAAEVGLPIRRQQSSRRVDGIGLSAAALQRPLGSADLDHALTSRVEEGREPGPIVSAPTRVQLRAPGSTCRRSPSSFRYPRWSVVVSACASTAPDREHGRNGQGVAVGIDADDAVDLFCQHGHAVVLPSGEDDRVVGGCLGGVTAWQNRDESRR